MNNGDCGDNSVWAVAVDSGLAAAIKAAGNRYRLAQLLGIHPTSVLRWKKVPVHRVLEIEEKTGVPREILRPDLYRRRLLEDARPECFMMG